MECILQIKKKENYKIDGTKIKIARTEKGWTISDLANMSGVTRKTIGEIENGNKRRIRHSTIHQIAITLDKEVEYFCTQIEKG
ncbi:helix-turn-helix domain-containing protein [Bacillus weihaiensis]|uniref:HTH cro/C1-type domain-containing protein n=1 Tax=Bacillus weihaiensis TaxID=1547283 RepID=A0A1L3MWC3_9BACI|nr:helix-turn-helix transcriptional regulator [Bacillus weihaiensis]APH06628.1 hypothetical protein A9C19_19065 [Bacillus weihaiensis]